MRFADILKMCFDSLSRRKGRTILTVLGVFIGCTSIIVMVSIGAGMQEIERGELDADVFIQKVEEYARQIVEELSEVRFEHPEPDLRRQMNSQSQASRMLHRRAYCRRRA